MNAKKETGNIMGAHRLVKVAVFEIAQNPKIFKINIGTLRTHNNGFVEVEKIRF
jgi:hypothetical protein